MHIECRRWFDRRDGNSYFTARFFDSGEMVAQLPIQYGYGEHCLDQAKHKLINLGYISAVHITSNPTVVFRECKFSYSIIDVTRKKDL